MLKKISFFFILIIQISNAQSQNTYQIKSCKIDFIFGNGFQKGTKTLIFSDSGKVEKEYGVLYIDTTKANKIQMELNINRPTYNSRTVSNSLIIQTPDSVFSIDLDSMTGSKRERFNMDMSSIFNDQKKTIGEDTLLNKKCDIIDFHGYKIWYWKGIALKKELILSPDEKIYEYAISIDENYIIKENEFKVPSGIKMQ